MPFPEAKARSAASSTPDETPLTRFSGSEELDVVSVEAAEADAEATHSPAAAKELLEVLQERFLPSRRVPSRRCLPFFPDVHTEVSASWSRPVSARVYNPCTALYSSLAEAKRHGYGRMPAAEGALASHVSPAAVSLRTPVLPTKPSRTTSVLMGRAYSAAGQAACCLHTMAHIQAYQAELLADVAEGTELTLEAVSELRHTADLALRATKETAKSVGRSMAAMVATEQHLWLSHSALQEKDMSFLLDAPLSMAGPQHGTLGRGSIAAELV